MDQPTGGATPKPKPSSPRAAWNASGPWLLLVLMMALGFLYFAGNNPTPKLVTYDAFRKQLKANNIKQVEFSDHEVIGKFKEPLDGKAEKPGAKPGSEGALDFRVILSPLVGDDLDKELLANDVRIEAAPQTDSTAMVLIVYMVMTLLLIAGVWMMFRRARDQFMGGGILAGFSKSPAKRYETSNKPVTFADVAGLGRRQARPARSRRVPEEPGKVPAPGRTRAQGHAADGAAGHRQDAAGPRRGGRGGRAVLFDQRLRVHPDVRRRRRQPRARHVQDGQGGLALRSCSSTKSTPSAASAAPAWAADTTSASRRSTRSSARWTASARTNR